MSIDIAQYDSVFEKMLFSDQLHDLERHWRHSTGYVLVCIPKKVDKLIKAFDLLLSTINALQIQRSLVDRLDTLLFLARLNFHSCGLVGEE